MTQSEKATFEKARAQVRALVYRAEPGIAHPLSVFIPTERLHDSEADWRARISLTILRGRR